MSGLTLADVFDLLGGGELAEMFVGGARQNPDGDRVIDPIALDDDSYYRQKDTGSPFDPDAGASAGLIGLNGLNGQVISGGQGSQGAEYPGGGDSGIREADRARLARHVEMGLRALYSRFLFASDTLEIPLDVERSLYPLVVPPGQGAILKVDAVHVGGRELVLGVRHDPCAVQTPRHDRLLFPQALLCGLHAGGGGCRCVVSYRALHPRIDPADATDAPEAVAIELPAPYLQALLFFVASRIMNPVGMVEEFHAGNTYAAKYEQECRLLEAKNLDVDDMSWRGRFHDQGFV